MSKARWSDDDMRKAGLVQGPDGTYVPVKSLAAKGKVSKLPPLNMKKVHSFTPIHNGMLGPFGEPWVEPVPNKKVRNATKSVNDAGVKFDSALERFMYDLLKRAGIDFDFQVEYLLQEKFRYRGEAIRAITLTVDFYLSSKNMIIDTKGHQTQQGALRWKLLKNKFATGEIFFEYMPTIELPSTKKECQELLNRLLYDKK